MASVKISSSMDEMVWEDLQRHSKESSQSISGLLTKAVKEFLNRKTLRQEVLESMEDSFNQNEELGQLLAK